jgi:hypothetical protein
MPAEKETKLELRAVRIDNFFLVLVLQLRLSFCWYAIALGVLD